MPGSCRAFNLAPLSPGQKEENDKHRLLLMPLSQSGSAGKTAPLPARKKSGVKKMLNSKKDCAISFSDVILMRLINHFQKWRKNVVEALEKIALSSRTAIHHWRGNGR
jgi:hypothetical protein